MPSRHSNVVGGSSAARKLNCPGADLLLAKLPKVTNRDSFYSIEGTALHTVTEMLITEKITLEALLQNQTTINANGTDVVITEALIRDALIPSMEYWEEFLEKIDLWQLETEVQFPGIKDAFGTTDVIGRDDRDNITYITDWKYGAGEGVKAEYPADPADPFGDYVVNEQLMFYACGARNSFPQYFPAGCRVVLTIVQPRAREQEAITSAEVSLAELDEFEVSLRDAMTRSETKKGRWCRFQACQTICPHFTGALFDIEALSAKVPAVLEKTELNYQLNLLDILDAAPAVEALINEARAQAHLLMSNGEELPGWKLVAKRGTRQWTVDESKLPKLLGLKKGDLYDIKLKSPAGVEKILPKKVKLPDGIASVVSSGTTIARAEDKRPAITADPNEISKILLEVLGDAE